MRRARRRRSSESGFTLIEMMFVVAIVAILAAIAIPAFTEQSRKGQAQSEVIAWFAELQLRQEQFKVDSATNNYFDTSGPCPAAVAPTGQVVTCMNSGQPWELLKLTPPTREARCTYDVQAGNTSGTTVVGFTFTSPQRPWFYIVAECDEDGAGGTNAKFFVSSIDSNIQKINEGQ